MAEFSLRPFFDDYEALASIFNELYPEWPSTPEKLRQAEEAIPSHVFRQRWVAESKGRIVGTGILRQDATFFDPQQFFLNIWIRNGERRRGVGSAIFGLILQRLENFQVEWAQCAIPERFTDGVDFLGKRKFTESHRTFQSKLLLAAFMPDRFFLQENALKDRGISLRSLEDCSEPGYREQIFSLQLKVDQAAPGAELRAPRTFQDFWTRIDENRAKGEFFCLAMDGPKYVGIQNGGPMPGNDWFHVKVTGVLPEYRKMGIATVLKAKGMAYAQSRGFSVASTWNDSRNVPMLALNDKFGFVREPASLSFIRYF